ncbi:MAG: carbohydrate ABC transporter substrate-binding protein, partial [Clostridiales bacterium]|nr:carbohydrate ABC transporter substrate-binding protein [Clostridiales bacterium]
MKNNGITKCLVPALSAALLLAGCGAGKSADGVTEIELVQYKPEAVEAFKEIEQRFNETHSDIRLSVKSPNEAMTILKTRF